MTYARAVLLVLVILHVGAFWLYGVHRRQADALQLFATAREDWRTGRFDTAAAQFRLFAEQRAALIRPFKLVQDFPTEASAWFMLANVEAARGRKPAAIEAYEHALALDPRKGRREYRDLLLETGAYDKVERRARAELAADRTDASAYWDLAAVELGRRDYHAAALHYDASLRILPDWLRRNHLLPVEQRAEELTPQEADVLNLAAVAWLRTGDTLAATQRCGEVTRRQLQRDPRDQLCLAALAEARGDHVAATEALRSYVPAAPEHDWLLADLRERLARGAPGTPAAAN
jgi:tetratricopeptide (TPR) repeat protein